MFLSLFSQNSYGSSGPSMGMRVGGTRSSSPKYLGYYLHFFLHEYLSFPDSFHTH